jgi:3-dehydroquinate synthase
MRWALMAALLVAAVIGSKLVLENLLGIDTEAVAMAWLASAGAGSALVIAGLLAADVFLPVPSSVLMVLSGAAFGVAHGALVALVGSVLGEWLGFELVRRYGRGLAARIVGDDDVARFSRFFERHGAVAVIVTRPLPVVMETMSVVAGLAGMRRGTFLAASVIGTLPIVVLYASAGAASMQMGSVLPAAVILAALGAAGWVAYRGR